MLRAGDPDEENNKSIELGEISFFDDQEMPNARLVFQNQPDFYEMLAIQAGIDLVSFYISQTKYIF